MLRILLHRSRLFPWETVRKHLNRFTLKMQYSGYNKAIRHDVTKSAIHAFQTMMEIEDQKTGRGTSDRSRRRTRRRTGIDRVDLIPSCLYQRQVELGFQ